MKTRFSQLQKKGHFDGLVDEGKSQSQKLALRAALAENTKLTENSAPSASSAVKEICLPSNVVVGGVNLGNLRLNFAA